jgi:hypothetical protein
MDQLKNILTFKTKIDKLGFARKGWAGTHLNEIVMTKIRIRVAQWPLPLGKYDYKRQL